jgi:mannan endo-1,4-beta-mannosidase
MKKLYFICPLVLFISAFLYPQSVNFTISAQDSLLPISPYIYGTNQTLSGGENWSVIRLGGNRLTGYNWENNASNAGSDYNQQSDNYLTYSLGISSGNENIPGIVVTTFNDQSMKLGAKSIVTLQMAGYAAKDKNGPVSLSETAPSPRWAKVMFEKGDSLSLQPDINDTLVYMDEFVNFLVNKYGTAYTPSGIMGYELDNEPALWPSTHPRIHPTATTCQEIVQKGISLSTAVKKLDPYAKIFGPVLYGMGAYTNFQSAPDWNTVSRGKSYTWFIDYYLDQMKQAETTAGKRLLDVLDIHWYSEATGVKRITDAAATTFADDTARVNAPRTLWDSPLHYVENSWIGQWEKAYLPLIPKLLSSINKYYPGTKLAFTEYNYGGENDITGAIAVDDVLGIFAKYGVYSSAFWGLQSNASYISTAYKLYRNYDGNNSTFGDLYVPSFSNDSVNCSVYGSIKTLNNEIHLIVINKNASNNINGSFSIASKRKILSGRAWLIDANSDKIKEIAAIDSVSNNAFTYTLPSLSVCHIVLQSSDVTGIAQNKTIPVKYELQAYPNPFNPACKINYSAPWNSISKLEIYSIEGSLIKTFSQLIRSGSVYWDGMNNRNQKSASGIYFAVLRNGNQVIAKEKLVLIK